MENVKTSTIHSAFRCTGMFPLNMDSIDRSKLVADSTPTASALDDNVSLLMECDDGTGNASV